MFSFQRILVPTDFGEPAEHALDLAIELAKTFDAKLVLLHVYEPPAVPAGGVFALAIEELAVMARKSIDEELTKAKARHPNCDGIVRAGSPADEIIAMAEETATDLIVVGTHGRRGFRALFGSVAEKVVRLAQVPVLTVSSRGVHASNAEQALPATTRSA